MSAKVLRRDVQAAHDRWAMAAQRLHPMDLELCRLQGRYDDLRRAWETQTGRPFIKPRK